jgi:hypothetical protein
MVGNQHIEGLYPSPTNPGALMDALAQLYVNQSPVRDPVSKPRPSHSVVDSDGSRKSEGASADECRGITGATGADGSPARQPL